MKKNNVKQLYKSQDFALSQKKYARMQDRETVTFRNSALLLYSTGAKVFQLAGSKKSQETLKFSTVNLSFPQQVSLIVQGSCDTLQRNVK